MSLCPVDGDECPTGGYCHRCTIEPLTKTPQVCYTITMPLKDFKREAANAYYNRDIEALTALLDKIVEV